MCSILSNTQIIIIVLAHVFCFSARDEYKIKCDQMDREVLHLNERVQLILITLGILHKNT